MDGAGYLFHDDPEPARTVPVREVLADHLIAYVPWLVTWLLIAAGIVVSDVWSMAP